ncbi:hypothetical protein TI03_03290 [Achromatium sp. WMS1]|nr:hypothetical protein TI03_03290 [Achromatium sp. WMS1]
MQEYLQHRHVFKFLKDIQESAIRAANIIKDMLNYSRRTSSSFVKASIGELIDMALELARYDYDLRSSYDFNKIEVCREGDEDTEIQCDKVAIEQVLLNILRNSAQAMISSRTMSTKSKITIKTLDKGTTIQLEISDNGPGMNTEIEHKAFEPFFTTKPIGVGTGLGLSVTKFIITQKHHGTIKLYTSPQTGTRFVICLPKDGTSYVTEDFNC